MSLLFLFLLKTFAIEIPPDQYLLGLETTTTSTSLMQSQYTDEIRNFTLSGKKIPIELIPEHEVYLERIYNLLSPWPYRRSKLSYYSSKPSVHIVHKKMSLVYRYDPHVIEINTPPFFAETFHLSSATYKYILFDVPQSAGLWPLRNWGMHHFHLDVHHAFKNDPLFYRNFWAYELNEQKFYETVGEDIESRLIEESELKAIFNFIKNVIDPLIAEWQNNPRIISHQEWERVARGITNPDELAFYIQTNGRQPCSKSFMPQDEIQKTMGKQIRDAMHDAIIEHFDTYIMEKSAPFTRPRLKRKNPWLPETPLRETIEFRRIPGLKSVEEIQLWIIYIVQKLEFVRRQQGLINLRSPTKLTSAKEQIHDFNSHLLTLGLLPEYYRTFLRPQFQALRVPIDLCRVRLIQRSEL